MLAARLNREIDLFLKENGEEPKFIVLNPGTYGELAYEEGINSGMKEDDALLNDIFEYNFITIAVTTKPGFKDFELR